MLVRPRLIVCLRALICHVPIVKISSEWVLLENPEVSGGQIRGGRVVDHHPDRDEFDRRALGYRLKHFGVVFTGKMPADMEYVL